MRQIVANATAQVLPTIQKHWIEGVIGLSALGIAGLVYFQAGKTVTATVPGALEKSIGFLREGASASADYLDFQKSCGTVGGMNTFKPRGNAVGVPGTWCSNLTTNGEIKMRELFPEATPPSGM